ncbi:hypothetical protein Zm00014a_044084 [Zea mays]|uniref:Secreted protein n=2 Tax=Zea mays TaxID=4577 RepID=A0A8J8YHJ9_MAIZE|nr:unknown [Zea mays]PWZ26517.1 hypothetical protein Zm00014a_044084 [Zea mays]
MTTLRCFRSCSFLFAFPCSSLRVWETTLHVSRTNVAMCPRPRRFCQMSYVLCKLMRISFRIVDNIISVFRQLCEDCLVFLV